MADIVSTARTARELLATGLNALQADPNAPAEFFVAAEPIAMAMGALHRIERSAGTELTAAAPEALEAVRKALGILQSQTDPRVGPALESVAGSLGMIFQLTKEVAPQPVVQQPAPQPAPQFFAPPPVVQPAPQPAPQPVVQQPAPQPAPQFFAPPPVVQPAPQPAPQQVAPQPAPQFFAPPPVVQPAPQPAPEFFAPPPQVQPPPPVQQQVATAYAPTQPAVQAAPPAPPAPPPPAPEPVRAAPTPPPAVAAPIDPNLPRVEAELGTHSQTNFYKGLSGNDVVDHGGLFIATYNVPRIGTQLHVHVALPGGYEFDAVGVVRWIREMYQTVSSDISPPGFGLQFTTIAPEARNLVYRYVRNREPMFHDDL